MLFLGIDGGGTKTKAIVINEKEEILYEGLGGPSSIDTVSNETTVKNINVAVKPFFELPQYKDSKFNAVFVGAGGVADESLEKHLLSLIKDLIGVDKNTILVAKGDHENALASGLIFDGGMTLIVGTGTVCFGKDKEGNTFKSAGLGYQEGDLGSGYDLGRKAIQYAARSLDNRIKPSKFTKDICKELNLFQPSDVAKLMLEWHTERTKVAALGPIITDNATEGDHHAIEICDNAVKELVMSVVAVQDILKLENPKLVIVGTLGNRQTYYKDLLWNSLKEAITGLEIVSPQVDPALASAMLAKRAYDKR